VNAAHDLLAALAPATDFADAPCVGRWALFDPPNDHENPPRRSTPATRPLCTCAAPARCPPSPTALPPPAPYPRRTAAVCGRGAATTNPREASDDHDPRPARHCRAAHQADTRRTCPRSTVHATTDTVHRTALPTPDPRCPVPHPRATTHRQEPVMPDSHPPEKYGVPRGLECPTCGRFGRLEMRNDAIRWAVGHQDGCAVLLSSRPVAR